jgi:protease I
MPKALIIIAQKGYQDIEEAETRKALEAAGQSIVHASSSKGACIGKLGGTMEATVTLKDVRVANYDRIAFIGGPGAAVFAEDPEVLRIAREAVAADLPLGAICIAPTILAAAGVLRGKRATVWDDGQETQIRFLEGHGALYSGERVTVDGLIVTGNGPAAAEEFGKALAGMRT